jgi:hypothetical protein
LYAVGRIWAGDVEDIEDTSTTSLVPTGDGDNRKRGWQGAQLVCRFRDSEHCDPKTNEDIVLRQKLDCTALLRVNKQVHAEAHEILFSTNIFALMRERSFHDFFAAKDLSGSGLSESQLRLVRNISIHIQPASPEMRRWNDWLNSVPDALDTLRGLRKLQIVVAYDFAEKCRDWAELWRIHWLLSFARVRVPEVSVDVSLCRWRTESEKDDVEDYAQMLEGKMLSPWDQIEEDVRELYSLYWNKEKKKRVW